MVRAGNGPLVANEFWVELGSPDSTVVKGPKVAGLTTYRTEGEFIPEHGWEEGRTYVFLGEGWQWNQDGDMVTMQAEPAPGVAHTQVQTLVVIVQAHEARAREMIKQIDWQVLKALLRK